MSYCSNCGVEIEPGNKFCSNCGTRIRAEGFDIDAHIVNLKRKGMQIINEKNKIETKNWDPEKYLNNVFQSIVAGGFSYFTYGEVIEESEVVTGIILKSREKMDVREKNPLLLEGETLEFIGNVRRNGFFGEHGGTTFGPMYFTGRRFILDTLEFETETYMGQEIEYSLPLTSYWIKPDFTNLFKRVDFDFFFKDGIIRKKRFNTLKFELKGIEKPGILSGKALTCGYHLRGEDEMFFDFSKQHIVNLDEKPIEEFSEMIHGLIEESLVTDVCSLIEHTYSAIENRDSVIETSLAYSGRNLESSPYSLCGRAGLLV
ncbi:zinc-ribbon domain-containing protein [Candidatus Bathyarchaeota archaeon]|nr:zinc-ribbon domain-containing protein [Candidatus Bathyarchaeota archaeon]